MSDLLPPQSAGRAWRERFTAALADHPRLSPDTLLDTLANALPEDPVAVFKALASILPKELDVTSQGQVNHLHLMRIVATAQDRGIDLSALAAGILPLPQAEAVDTRDWLR